MVQRTGPSNPELQELIMSLKKVASEKNVKLWKRIASELERPARQRRVVNIDKIEKSAREKEIVIVPGKVLGNGELKKNIKVAAFHFSDAAKEKIKDHCTITELLKDNPSGKGVRIIG